tara:strand:- start:3606 stop:4169 length:564 start_codon:yes stop_codon:yes gene_type:complete
MRVGIDCDGVLRDFIPDLINKIKETHPEHADKIGIPYSWNWEDWLPFWTEGETEKYVFETHFKELFGSEASVIETSLEDWTKLKEWAKENGHELVLVSAQRKNCEELTKKWLQRWGFTFDEMHFTHKKWSVDVDVLIDDSPAKLGMFKKKSVAGGVPICFRQAWNTKSQQSKITIDRLSDITNIIFG